MRAEWRINSVWHDAREKPDKGKLLIVEDIDGAYDLVFSDLSHSSFIDKLIIENNT